MVVALLAICSALILGIYMHAESTIPSVPNQSLSLHGHFILNAYHSDGTQFAHVEKDNLITTNGFKGASYLLFNANSGITASKYNYLAIGSGSTGASASDTALGTECGYSRQQTSSPSYSSAVSTLTGTFTGAACTAAEVGVFDASTSGNMISRQTYSTITLASSDTMTVTYTFTLS
jgi:hypothetical protein